ncbi:MAG: copper chaperone PCu(A)C [Chiayiivirga sp.]|nr:copper chaperone PCu(A)C [Chiayiivirga sp.]MEB2317010.1 copper chaperone PCu(A)C [Xanthomonadaceae bacterium]HRO87064.1 copper chaperone PCu(A)C [Chiayiivirga sp.]HRQ34834.1 copper chaperone PCu(A)C [Chiayiivirga sp.]
MNARLRLMGWGVLALASAMVQAQESPDAAALVVHEAWIRTAPPTAPVRAGYGVIENSGRREVVIDAVRSDAFGAIEIHEMREVDGVMRMRRLPSLTLEPGRSVSLEPGGMHLMLFRAMGPLEAGARVSIGFFAREVEVARAEFVVRETP